jgi:hypothetical protein
LAYSRSITHKLEESHGQEQIVVTIMIRDKRGCSRKMTSKRTCSRKRKRRLEGLKTEEKKEILGGGERGSGTRKKGER